MKHRIADQTLPEALRERGVDPSEVGRIVMTHLHLDHVSGSGQFPQATFTVDSDELAAGRRGGGPYIKSHLATIERWQAINFAEGEPFESFARTVDVFGDGSVRLVSSPGHSPGHMTVLLKLSERYALICGDAAMSLVELREPVIDGIILDQDKYIRSGGEAREFMRAHPDTLAIPSTTPSCSPRSIRFMREARPKIGRSVRQGANCGPSAAFHIPVGAGATLHPRGHPARARGAAGCAGARRVGA